MKLLIDASNLKVGGAIQVCLSVIEQLSSYKYKNIEVYYVLSRAVYQQAYKLLPSGCYEIITTDIKTTIPWDKNRRRIQLLAESYDYVFTIFGPTFWGKAKRHLIGFANPWIVTPDTIAYKKFNIITMLLMRLKVYILSQLLWSDKVKYVTETDIIKERFISKYKCSSSQIDVVSNCLNYIYKNINIEKIQDKFNLNDVDCKRFVTISHDYPHKNLSIIPQVYSELKKKGIDSKFIVTINKDSYLKKSDEFKNATINIGPVDISDCPSIYKYCHALFMPTLLECFTASYLEAMKMRIPICTSDLDFARTICGNAALYFDPLDPKDIASKLIDVTENDFLSEMLVNNGDFMLKRFPDHTERVENYIRIISEDIDVQE